MTRLQLRNQLRRRLQDKSGSEYDTADLNDLINQAIADLQGIIEQTDKNAFVRVSRRDVVDASADPFLAWYDKPSGYRKLYLLEKLDSSDSLYKPVPRITFDRQRRGRSTTSDLSYAEKGNYFVLDPPPTAALANGLQLTWSPTIALGDDTESPDQIRLPVHPAIVHLAVVSALPEHGAAATEARNDLAQVVSLIPGLYAQDTTPQILEVNLDRRYTPTLGSS